jgi:Family of unknown function (DUF6247)
MRAHDIQTVSDFARNPNTALKKIEQGDIFLRRTKGKGSIRVSLESRAQAASTGMGEMARVLALFIQTLPLTSPAFLDALTTHYPWMRFLPERDRAEFVREFLETMKDCASINNFSRIEAVVNAWRSSAEIHADPELLAHLTKPLSGGTGPALRRS